MSNYTPYYEGGWKNEEEMTTTPICAEALNHIEDGIQEAHDMIDGLTAIPMEVRQAILALFQAAAYAETGLTDEIAVIESWATVAQYSVTNSLTNVTNSNSSTLVGENSAYRATLTSDVGYIFDSVTVTMGDVDITNQVFTPST